MDRVIGLPFVEGGRDLATGLDCWGLVVWMYSNALQLELPQFRGQRTAAEASSQAVQAHRHEWVQVDRPALMDLVLFRVKGLPCHMGVVLDQRRFVHAEESAGVVIEHLSSIMWSRRLVGFGRYSGPR